MRLTVLNSAFVCHLFEILLIIGLPFVENCDPLRLLNILGGRGGILLKRFRRTLSSGKSSMVVVNGPDAESAITASTAVATAISFAKLLVTFNFIDRRATSID